MPWEETEHSWRRTLGRKSRSGCSQAMILPRKWAWKTIRDEAHPKETYYLPFAESRGVLGLPGEGRDKLAREAASHYDRIRVRCKEDIQRLEDRIRDWTEDRE